MQIDGASTVVQSGPIAVVPYDGRWPAVFERLREAIGQTLKGLAFEAHHIGSTAVPDLCAKPKIDIDVVLCCADDLAMAVDLLKETDRDYHGDPYGEGMWTFTSPRGLSPGHRIYLCTPQTPTHVNRILFRDYLRANPAIAAAYGALKQRLVMASGGVWKTYSEGKSAFVAGVVERVRRARPSPP